MAKKEKDKKPQQQQPTKSKSVKRRRRKASTTANSYARELSKRWPAERAIMKALVPRGRAPMSPRWWVADTGRKAEAEE